MKISKNTNNYSHGIPTLSKYEIKKIPRKKLITSTKASAQCRTPHPDVSLSLYRIISCSHKFLEPLLPSKAHEKINLGQGNSDCKVQLVRIACDYNKVTCKHFHMTRECTEKETKNSSVEVDSVSMNERWEGWEWVWGRLWKETIDFCVSVPRSSWKRDFKSIVCSLSSKMHQLRCAFSDTLL